MIESTNNAAPSDSSSSASASATESSASASSTETEKESPTASPTDDPFYGPALERADSQLQPLDVYQDVRRYASWLVGALLVLAAVGWWRSS